MMRCAFQHIKKRRQVKLSRRLLASNNDERLLVVFGLENLATTVVATRTNVVAQMGFPSRRLNCKRRNAEMIVRAMHATLGRGLLVLLNGHDDS